MNSQFLAVYNHVSYLHTIMSIVDETKKSEKVEVYNNNNNNCYYCCWPDRNRMPLAYVLPMLVPFKTN